VRVVVKITFCARYIDGNVFVRRATMTEPEIPGHVLQFLAEKIDSVSQFEALLLLWQEPNRSWTAEQIGARVYVAPETARLILQGLERRQLIVAEEKPSAYRYSSAWDASGNLMAEVAMQYRRHLVRLATFIHSGASPSVREFARAFDLKKER
jgi:predicted ArsR family transcriptional regulator